MSHPTKILCIRMSSLGDVLLATRALVGGADVHRVTWLTSEEYAPLLEQAPGVESVITFRRKEGLFRWLALAVALRKQGWDEVWDLHGSIRSRLLRLVFLGSSARWKTISKERWKSWGYYTLKRYWPASLRPTAWRARYAKFSAMPGPAGDERWVSDRRQWLAGQISSEIVRPERKKQIDLKISGKTGWVALMPSALGVGKTWPIEHWVSWVKLAKRPVVVMGTDRDEPSRALVKRLSEEGLDHWDAVGLFHLPEVAYLLSRVDRYVGCDTGLAHLAESLGVPTTVLFGPTRPDQGFGPWRVPSRSVATSWGCSPCGKDGSYCWRVGAQRWGCMGAISADDLQKSFGGAV